MADRKSAGSSASRRSRTSDHSIGQFIIGAEIGKGSFAQVYSGTHQTSGALVAIKSVELGRLNKKLKDNLYSEIQILKKLRHPHIVALHDCIESSTHINLIMEYCELGDLSLFIKKREKLATHPVTCEMARKYPSVPNAGLHEVVNRHFLKQLASALQFLRQGNFVHRDVKPQNLLLLPSVQYRSSNKEAPKILSASHDSLIPAAGLESLPMLKLADFGFARVLPSTSLAETLCGSPLYMAPEILRYERYDAKADLWSVGTVLYEMVSGKPPFRASNHVELLRKIENAEDQIRFPKDCQVSSDLKSLIRALLKRNPVERLSFENFFNHPVVTGSIPGLVEDDIPSVPKPSPRDSRDARAMSKTDEPLPSPSRTSFLRRHRVSEADAGREEGIPSSPREKPLRSSPLASPSEFPGNDEPSRGVPRVSSSPRDDLAPGLGIRRPQPVPSTSAPSRPTLLEDRRRRGLSNASLNRYQRDEEPSPPSALREYPYKAKGKSAAADERERVAQEIAFERDYVVVEKRYVEVNALADQLAAQGAQAGTSSPKSGQIVRRATQQGVPTSTTGAIPAERSKALQIAQGSQRPDHYRRGSYDKNLSGSPSSTTSVISKAIQDASLRLFGFKYPAHLLGKGTSPPLYNPFPTYPTPTAPTGLLTDGRQSGVLDEDVRIAQGIEDYATRSDCVWGFAEVKLKQLMPLTPSSNRTLGGIPADEVPTDDDDGLTVEAEVALSEEALVLYVKALTLLARCMDIAGIWWTRKGKGDGSSPTYLTRESSTVQTSAVRINSAVQWVRKRFNETLEKADLVREKLIQAQRKLPEDHPSHPNNHHLGSASLGTSGADGVMLTAGLSAEKLMYDRALEMSRTAAINEISNEDLQGCEISYLTAIRMLEAVLDNDEGLPTRKVASGATSSNADAATREGTSEIDTDDQEAVQKMIRMISVRLSSLQKKLQIIANASKAEQQGLGRKRSGEIMPRSVPTY
ncbi:Serine/threonine-protein kinase ATG1 [Apiospora arundinis]|uniref:non-specific serine/threonine protein kinase n=1 Tax=Apiospora arundinis TaxID=335852 RepID=A0ABR2J5V3_9PEZI